MENTTIAAISTPEAAGALGVVRISGEKAIDTAAKIFTPVNGENLNDTKGYRAHFGTVHDAGARIDEAVCLVFRAPHSYTGENTAEITCHGGLYVTKAVLRAAFNAGAVPAEAGEFTKRAFLNGKIDLAESEAVMALISARGKQAATAALNTLDGRLSRKIGECAGKITAVLASLAAWVDYPYDEIEDTSPAEMLKVFSSAENDLTEIIERYDTGRVFTEGIDTAIVGRPNVGKSTLMNLLSGCERSIVTDVAGTTRDVVEQSVRLGSLILNVSDTAGIHETADRVESIGVQRAKTRMQRAALVLAVFDSSEPLNSDDLDILEACRGKLSIAVINKTDLPEAADISGISDYVTAVVRVSAATGEGEKELEQAVSDLLCSKDFNPENPCLQSERQRECCVRALGCIKEAIEAIKNNITLDAVTVCAQRAVDALLELTGEKAADAVINEVFSRFCVGK